MWDVADGECECQKLPEGHPARKDHAGGRGSPGKHPVSGQSEATTDPEVIGSWWPEAYPDAWNVGLIPGDESGFWVLDVDPRSGGDAALRALLETHGDLPETALEDTGGGGLHVYFRWPEGAPRAWRKTIGPGLDVLHSDAPYVIASPSRHYSGGRYAWAAPPGDLADAPEWLLALATGPAPDREYAPVEHLPTEWPPATEAELAAARAALKAHGPAVLGQKGDAHTVRAGAILLRDWALTWEEAEPLAREWNEGCRCPARPDGWAPDALERKMHNGLKYGTGEVGAARARLWGSSVVGEIVNTRPPEVRVDLTTAERPKEPDPDDGETLRGDAAKAGGFLLERYWHRRDMTPTLRRWRGAWYAWTAEEGCYREVDAEVLFAQILRSDWSEGDVTDAGKLLKALIAYPSVRVPDHVELGSWLRAGDRCDPLDTATCRNGLLCIPTGVVTPATPLYFSTTCLSVAHDPGAPAPERWLAFLGEVFQGDTEAVTLLQEWFGYCLTPDTRQQKMLFMVGKKRSGKGTILNIFGGLLGEANIVSPSLSDLTGEFGLWPLLGKTAALFPDVRHDGRHTSTRMIERLLSITGGDRQSVNRKSMSFWHGRIGARIALATNTLPDMRDSSDALVSRMMVLDMPTSFFGREDKDLSRKLGEELPGILLWALDGWRSLRARGRFVQPTSSSSTVSAMHDLSSPVGAWLSERCSTDPADSKDPGIAGVRCSEAFENYRSWCIAGEHRPENVTRFGADVKARGFERTRSGARSEYVFRYDGLFLRK